MKFVEISADILPALVFLMIDFKKLFTLSPSVRR